MNCQRPSVGLLFNPTSPYVIAEADQMVQHIAINPGQFFYDLGADSSLGQRFFCLHSLLEQVSHCCGQRPLTAHGFSLSLPSAKPLDKEMVEAISSVGEALGGFDWFSEHLNLLSPPKGAEPNCEAGMALPVSYDEENYTWLSWKLQQLKEQIKGKILLENPAIITPLEAMEMSEPEFFNRLHQDGLCGTLLDLHNVLVSARNGGLALETYLQALNPLAVEEVHLAGGEDFHGFYTDSHSTLTPKEVWEMAYAFLPRCPNLRAITFEYNDSYFSEIGTAGVCQELERMHALADACSLSPIPCEATC
ncbi:MAG: DUF692 family multinuclear iron-containing protein [Cyanobacteriota bacterium]|jgi:uncharacterized protein (UPF0276 family)